MPAPTVTISPLDPAQVDVVEPLWNAMREHHAETMPQHGPVRSREASWAMRRERYTEWLAEPASFGLLARDAAGEVLGYAIVTDLGPETTFERDRVGCLESIAVLPSARRAGVGSALIAAARAGAAERGIPELTLTVFSANASALAFYARHGFAPYLQVLTAPTASDAS
jgi:ribosomal protein S18 acetylase RimI-like enzyme